MSERKKCSEKTKAGRECQAWAMADTEPPLCWAHWTYSEERKNMRATGKNQEAAGLYRRQLSPQEREEIRTLAEDRTLNSELVLNRIFLRRLLVALQENDDLDPVQLAKLAPVIFRGTQAVARILQEERALNGKTDDDAREAIGQALEELSRELGM